MLKLSHIRSVSKRPIPMLSSVQQIQLVLPFTRVLRIGRIEPPLMAFPRVWQPTCSEVIKDY